METIRSTADVSMQRAARFGKQLCAHLGRKWGGSWDAEAGTGWVDLNTGRLDLAARADALSMTVTGPAQDLAMLEDVAGRHLVRFATHEHLRVQWQRESGEPGTVQETATESAAEPTSESAAKSEGQLN